MLQGFPGTFKLHPNKNTSNGLFGNSVTVPIVQSIFEEILKTNIFSQRQIVLLR